MNITLDEIRSKAPEGATHYEVEANDVDYYAKDYMDRWCSDDGHGNWYPLRQSEYDQLDLELKPL